MQVEAKITRQIEEKLRYKFNSTNLLEQAFTHASYAYEHGVIDYERLEFLGDSLLEAITSKFLYDNFDKYKEGKLSKIRAQLVSEDSLYRVIKELGLDRYILVGGSIDSKNISKSIVADIFESIVAAIYLDSGFDNAQKFVYDNLIISTSHVDDVVYQMQDYKTMLQERLQALGKHVEYVAMDESKDGRPQFRVEAYIDGKKTTEAVGKSKKSAEKLCAKNILESQGGNQ